MNLASKWFYKHLHLTVITQCLTITNHSEETASSLFELKRDHIDLWWCLLTHFNYQEYKKRPLKQLYCSNQHNWKQKANFFRIHYAYRRAQIHFCTFILIAPCLFKHFCLCTSIPLVTLWRKVKNIAIPTSCFWTLDLLSAHPQEKNTNNWDVCKERRGPASTF